MGDRLMNAVGHFVHGEVRDGAVQRRGADERVDARVLGVFHRIPAAVDVTELRAGKAANLGSLRLARDLGHSGEVTL